MAGPRALAGVLSRLENRPSNALPEMELRKFFIGNPRNICWGQGYYNGWSQGK